MSISKEAVLAKVSSYDIFNHYLIPYHNNGRLLNGKNISKQFLLQRNQPSTLATDRWFDLGELCDYLPDKPAKATVYAYVSSNSIPCHKGAKKLRFLKSEIDSWLKQGKKRTVSEIEADANTFLNPQRKKGGRNANK